MSQQMLYVLLTGLGATMDRMTATTNNLANTNTVAFKAQQPMFQALPLYGQGLPDRVDVAAREQAANLTQGPLQQTGRDLDIAVKGQGWIGVQAKDGSIALTRNGSLTVSATGVLETSDGHPLVGQGGRPIVLPPLQSLTIGEDGTISGVLVGQEADQIAAINRLMLTNPPAASVTRRGDGLFQSSASGGPADAKVQVQVGALEGSNADSVGMMMNMIENSRMYQMQTELMHTIVASGDSQSTPLTLP